jgi:O-antigen/teichoic acid export membrane protein
VNSESVFITHYSLFIIFSSMSQIRRHSIISSIIIYFGFAIGLLNTYLFTKQGLFLDKEYGLYNAFIAIATIMMAFSTLAMPSYIYKFFPYYKSHLPDNKNEQISLALLIGIIGFALVVIAGVAFKGLVVRKFIEHADDIVAYYYWIFPLGFGFLIFAILEAYAWQLHKSIFTNFLKEGLWRFYTTVIIVVFTFTHNFDLFIKLFSFSYPFIALALLAYLYFTKRIHFTLRISKVTRRFRGSILKLCVFVYSGSLIFAISQVFDSLVISSVLDNALAQLAVYSVAQNISAMIQVPQRGIIAASIAHLSIAWKEKKLDVIQRIYQRSSLNQLIFACGLFILIVLNFTEAVYTFNLKGSLLDAYYVVILLGLSKIVDMGTGVNAQIIATSTYWRFEMLSGVVLLILILPLNYFLTKQFGILGPGWANLISITIYNLIRIIFLWKKFKLFPFTMQSLYTILLSAFCLGVCYYSLRDIHGLWGLILRTLAICLLYGAAVVYFRLSPDVMPVWQTLKKKIGIKN